MRFALNGLRWTLRKLSQLTIWRYRPGIIGVTGSVGKTSAKLAIAAVLGGERHVRISRGNLNSELGLPLAILGDWRDEELRLVSRDEPERARRLAKTLFWFKVIAVGVKNLVVTNRSGYPEILVLEYGADRPGDLKRLLAIARPNISVITAVGDIPVHVEFFAGPGEVAREKARLIEWLPSASFAVLNYDDETVMALKDRTRAHLLTFGCAEGADVRITAFENKFAGDRPLGIAFKLEYGGSAVPVRLEDVLGRAQAYAAAATACIGLVFGLNLIKISEALKHYRPAGGRMELVPGVRSAWILDDTYNASPLSMRAALDTLRDLPGKRKVAVLGDMREIGKYAMQAHERVGRLAARFVSVLVTVGPLGKFIAEAARGAGLARRNIHSFDTAEEAFETVQKLLRKGDLVLVKASHSLRLDAITDGIRAV
jgi:UDP-N-acetylmuramoyl-tripeptide--D-alanyl-D-alanine ligase